MRQYGSLNQARLPVRRCARATAVSRSSTVRAVVVARPHRQTFSYADLIQSYQRAEVEIAAANSSNTAGYNSSSRKDQPMYISDPAVYTNPKLMAKQIQNTFGQVITAGKAAIDEVRIAIDPQQRPHAVVVGDRVVVREATVQPKPHPEPLKAVAEQAVRLTQAVAEDVHNATQVSTSARGSLWWWWWRGRGRGSNRMTLTLSSENGTVWPPCVAGCNSECGDMGLLRILQWPSNPLPLLLTAGCLSPVRSARHSSWCAAGGQGHCRTWSRDHWQTQHSQGYRHAWIHQCCSSDRGAGCVRSAQGGWP